MTTKAVPAFAVENGQEGPSAARDIKTGSMVQPGSSSFGGVFLHSRSEGRARLSHHPHAPHSLPDPKTGRALRIATVEIAGAGAICPSCEERSEGGFVSFVADLRMVYACPQCEELVWMRGA